MLDFISKSVEDVFGENFDIIDEELAKATNHADDINNPHEVSFQQTIVQLESSANLNNISGGLFFFRNNTVNAPVDGTGLVMQASPNGGARFQLAVHDMTGTTCIYQRYRVNTGWSAWSSCFVSPAFTGTPTAPTARLGNSSTQLATTEFVANAISGIIIPEDTYDLVHTHTNKSVLDGILADDIDDWNTMLERFNTHTSAYNPHNVTKAQVGLGNVANESKTTMFTSPSFIGTPTAPTAAKGTSSQQLATTAFVQTTLGDIVVTKEAVGLGNVPNVGTNDQTPTYTEASALATLTSGEKLSATFGKIKLAITNLINHIANKSNPHSVTKSQIGLGNVTNESKTTMFSSPAFTGTPKAAASSAYTTAKLRNVVFWTSGTTAPTTSNGDIVIKTF